MRGRLAAALVVTALAPVAAGRAIATGPPIGDRLAEIAHDMRLDDLREELGGPPSRSEPLALAAVAAEPTFAPEPLWVPVVDDEPAPVPAPAADPAGDAEAALDAVSVTLAGRPGAYPGDLAGRTAMASWLARGAVEAGLPPQLPVMAALVESGLRNLAYGDRDSLGLFQMRAGIWDRGRYEGYFERPELQLEWFVDRALAVRKARVAAGDEDFGTDPETWGAWIADVERPAEAYRGRYQLRLGEATALLLGPSAVTSPFDAGPAPAAGAPGAADGPLPGAGPVAEALARRAVADPRITLPPQAEEDLLAGRIDPRLTAVLLAMAREYPIGISVLQSGHSYLTAGGSVSNHSVGRGVDIATVDGEPVRAGNRAAKRLALALADLPGASRPTEVGTPWIIAEPGFFTDAGHADHLHVAFDGPRALADDALLPAVADEPEPERKRSARRKPAPVPEEPAFEPAEPPAKRVPGGRSEPSFSPATPEEPAAAPAPATTTAASATPPPTGPFQASGPAEPDVDAPRFEAAP